LGATILVVDDEEAIRGLLVAVLEDEGYAVVAARDGRAALEAIAAAAPDLVVTDLMMPELDGRELIRRLRTRPEWAAIPVVLLSAAPPEGFSTVSSAAAVAKPFDLDALLGVIAAALGPGRAATPPA
jgi:two-component system chemotaxis response regulator CheY